MEKNLNTPPTQLYNIHYDMKTLFDSLPYTKSFAKGEIIYHQGDIADSFYYIKKGKATVFMISPDGMEKTLNTASKGELIGEGAFFDHKPRVSSAKAVTASVRSKARSAFLRGRLFFCRTASEGSNRKRADNY